MLVWIATSLFLIMAATHWGAALWFGRWLARHDATLSRSDIAPRTAVILTLRGIDPFLEQTLKSLLEQDYPQSDIHLIHDGDSHSMTTLIERVVRETPSQHRIHVEQLADPLPTCGLKCSALLQALSKVDRQVEVFALIDSDVVPPPRWLRNLVAPLVDEQVGVVTGGQWFEPSSIWSLGTWVRSIWNSGSLVPTAIQSNPWAGTLAIRRKDFEAAKLADIWRVSIVDDGPIARAMHGIGVQIVFEPRAFSINRENCSITFSFRYVARMLTWSRWYESTFMNTVIHAVLLLAIWLVMAVALGKAIYESNWIYLQILAAVTLVGSWIYAMSYDLVRMAVTKFRPGSFSGRLRMSFLRQVWVTLLLPAVHVCFLSGIFRAIFVKKISWRKAVYQIRARDKIRLLNHEKHGLPRTKSDISI